MSRRLSVLLPPDGCRVHFTEDSTVSEVKRRAADALKISTEDSRLFGLTQEDSFGQLYWLKEERTFEEQLPAIRNGENMKIHFKVRFFLDSILSLSSPSAMECYFLATFEHFIKGQLVISPVAWSQMMANLVQIFGGGVDREQAEIILKQAIPEPLRLTDPTSIKEVLDLHSEMKGVSRGLAMIRFLQLAERSPHYGCSFYHVKKLDETKCRLGVCSQGIVISHPSKEYKMFYWKQLDNLYYKDEKFTIEVHASRSTARESLEAVGDPELIKAVSDPTTQVSTVQRRQIRLHTFVCSTGALCRAIWLAAITQHQFYLDQKHRRPRHTADNEKIGRLISNSSLCSSLPSLSSLHAVSSSSSMPAAKVGDGSSSTASLPSLKEDRTLAREKYTKLKNRRYKLENDLRERMKDLLAACLKESEMTGEMPKEIKKALYPGQEIPKVKKRIGTSFSISEEFIKGDRGNRLNQLEADVEIHRKIVAAAERLAKDKTMNKSVRKKRQKDLAAATQKLKGLEMGLSQLRLSASKPDVSSLGSNGSGASWAALGDNPRLVAKSCPTTPHGSVPDLLQQNGEDEIDSIVTRRPPSEISRRSLAQRFSEASSSSSSLGLPPSGQRRSFTQRSVTSDELDNPLTSPIYENVGYRSTSYRSSYRQAHYPTIQDEQRRRSASAHSVQREIVGAPVAVVAPTPVVRKIPTSISCTAGFATASLDRREARQPPPKPTLPNGSSPSTSRVTTFPVAQANISYDNCLPRFQRPNLTHFPNRGALPPYSLGQSVSAGRLQAATDPHMEALLQYYKTEARKAPQKTATIV